MRSLQHIQFWILTHNHHFVTWSSFASHWAQNQRGREDHEVMRCIGWLQPQKAFICRGSVLNVKMTLKSWFFLNILFLVLDLSFLTSNKTWHHGCCWQRPTCCFSAPGIKWQRTQVITSCSSCFLCFLCFNFPLVSSDFLSLSPTTQILRINVTDEWTLNISCVTCWNLMTPWLRLDLSSAVWRPSWP